MIMKINISRKFQGWVKVLPFYLLTFLPSSAQKQWTLRECEDYAIACLVGRELVVRTRTDGG